MSFDLATSLNNILISETNQLNYPNLTYKLDNQHSSPVSKSPSKFKKQQPVLKLGLFNDVDAYEPLRADRAQSVDGGTSQKPMTAVTNMSVNPSQSSTM